MNSVVNLEKCTGCSACVETCPKKCIVFFVDSEGFSYPMIKESLCVGCGLCKIVCPVLNPYEKQVPLSLMAAISLDDNIRKKSSSGGVFSLLALQTINNGGVVFGARFDKKFQVVIDSAEDIGGITAFRGSKYVQADIGDSFSRCKCFLEMGRKVLFTGTPCQISGLKHFLSRDYDNLLTCDFICHGVPSPMVWTKYMEDFFSFKHNKNGVCFQLKRWGYKDYGLYAIDEDGISIVQQHRRNPYMRAFLENLILRPSCHSCPAKSGRSGADITIADFWGIENIIPQMNDDNGASLLIVNTKKGSIAIPYDKLKYSIVGSDVLWYNSAYFDAVKAHPKRGTFFEQLKLTDCSRMGKLILEMLDSNIKENAFRIHPRRCINNVRLFFKQLSIDYLRFLLGKWILTSVDFRDKSIGWRDYSIRFKLK